MKTNHYGSLLPGIGVALAAAVSAAAATAVAAAPVPGTFAWQTVVNNHDVMPPLPEKLQQLQPALGERERAGGVSGTEQGR